jgi:replication-associated recombination protein RarA
MPLNLSEVYRPQTLAGFVGLARPRALLSALAKEPYASAWLLVGPSGLGKTTMALALYNQLGGSLHHIPSRACDLATVESVVRSCWYTPMTGNWHVVLVDEADRMTTAAQISFLSVLDATAMPPNTIFVFTANETRLLEKRFLSRCRVVRFTTEELAEPAAKMLAKIWRKHSKAKPPDFKAILAESEYNIRTALMAIETEMIAPTSEADREAEKAAKAQAAQVAARPGKPVVIMGDIEQAQKRSETALKAWATRRAREQGAA